MLSFLTKKQSESSNENEKVLKLENEIKELKEKLKKTTNELKDEKIKNNRYYDEINSLKWALEEEQKNSEKLRSDRYKELYFDLLNLYGFENNNLKHSLLNIQDNISMSTSKAKENLKLSDNVDENFEVAFTNIQKIVDSLNNLLARSNGVAKVIDELSQKAVDIEKFVAQINEVVMQINILSLNASVEAASAGDAGKGFAVVASEVKNLANKTSAVASDIEKVVKTIRSSIKNTNKEFHEIDEDIISIHNSTEKYNYEIESLHKLTKSSLSEFKNLSDSIFMNLAKIDHLLWKVNTYDSIYAKKQTFEYESHENCRLGKWYQSGDGSKYFSNAPSYRKLDKPHAVIHNSTKNVLEQLNKDDKKIDYKKIIETLKYMEKSSSDVFNILDDILKETIR